MSEQRLIDANALKKQYYPFPCAIGVENAVTIRAINEAPTIDAVQVVRCGECRYRELAKVNCKGYTICPASGMEITDDDYCSYGERQEIKHE